MKTDPIRNAMVKYKRGEITLVGAARLAHMDTYEFLHFMGEAHKESVFSRA